MLVFILKLQYCSKDFTQKTKKKKELKRTCQIYMHAKALFNQKYHHPRVFIGWKNTTLMKHLNCTANHIPSASFLLFLDVYP